MRKIEDHSGIYRIRNVVNGKIYIGSAERMRVRWSRHRSFLKAGDHHSLILQRAWRKYGEGAFVFEIIEVVSDPAELIAREQFWLDALKPYERAVGYNIHSSARNSAGIKRSPETRAKMGAWQKGRTLPPETRAKISAARMGRRSSVIWTEEMRQSQRDQAIRRNADPAYREYVGDCRWRKGR